MALLHNCVDLGGFGREVLLPQGLVLALPPFETNFPSLLPLWRIPLDSCGKQKVLGGNEVFVTKSAFLEGHQALRLQLTYLRKEL